MKSYFLTLISFPALLLAAESDQWTWQNPLPQGNTLRCIRFTGTDTGYVAGDAGVILKTTDAGKTWTNNFLGNAGQIFALDFLDSKTGLVIGAGTNSGNPGGSTPCFKTEDGGANWTATDLGVFKPTRAVQWVASQEAFLGGNTGILRTTDGGKSWSLTPGIKASVISLSFVSRDTGFVLAGESWAGTVFRTTNGGTTFDTAGIPGEFGIECIRFLSSAVGFAGGADLSGNSVIRKTLDGGKTWSGASIPASASGLVRSIQFVNSLTAYGFGDGGQVLRSNDGGKIWTLQSPLRSTDRMFNGVWFTSPTTGYSVGWYGVILKSLDGGLSWNPVSYGTLGSSGGLTSTHFIDSQIGFAVGGESRVLQRAIILKTINGGKKWDSLATEERKSLRAVHFRGPNSGIAVGDSGAILKTDNQGATWASRRTAVVKNLQAVMIAGGNVAYACGRNGALLKSTDGGESWKSIESDTLRDLRAISFSDANTGIVVGSGIDGSVTQGLVLRTVDGGTTWQERFLGDALFRSVSFPTNKSGYLVNERGLIFKTADGGAAWDSVGTLRGLSPTSMQFLDPDTGYVSGGGGILRSVDGGVNWIAEKIPVEGYVTSISSLHFINGRLGYAVGGAGTILKYERGPVSLFGRNLAQSIGVRIDRAGNFQYLLASRAKVLIRLFRIDGGLEVKVHEGEAAAGEHSGRLPSGFSERGPFILDIAVADKHYAYFLAKEYGK